MGNTYTIGTEEVLLRVEMVNLENEKMTNMFFDTFEEMQLVIETMSNAHPGKYSFCNYGGYDMRVIGN